MDGWMAIVRIKIMNGEASFEKRVLVDGRFNMGYLYLRGRKMGERDRWIQENDKHYHSVYLGISFFPPKTALTNPQD